jgi:cysteine desulfurase / selenocysteine lyase
VSAHKMVGPMGIGGLFVKADLLPVLPPFLFGGGMINEVKPESASYIEDLEELFTAGTPDVASLVGWAAACEYLKKIGLARAVVHDQELVWATMEMLKAFPQIKVIGPTELAAKNVLPAKIGLPTLPAGLKLDRVGSVAFVYQGIHAHDVGQVLDGEGVAVRSGHHCTMPLHSKFNWQATTRVSFQVYNSLEDIEALRQGLLKVAQVFGV